MCWSSAAWRLDRGDDVGVAVAGRVDGDAGGEVEEDVAVDVFDRAAEAAPGDDRIGAQEARARPRVVELDVRPGLGAGGGGDDVRDGSCLERGRHGASLAVDPSVRVCPSRRSPGTTTRIDVMQSEYKNSRARPTPTRTTRRSLCRAGQWRSAVRRAEGPAAMLRKIGANRSKPTRRPPELAPDGANCAISGNVPRGGGPFRGAVWRGFA